MEDGKRILSWSQVMLKVFFGHGGVFHQKLNWYLQDVPLLVVKGVATLIKGLLNG